MHHNVHILPALETSNSLLPGEVGLSCMQLAVCSCEWVASSLGAFTRTGAFRVLDLPGESIHMYDPKGP